MRPEAVDCSLSQLLLHVMNMLYQQINSEVLVVLLVGVVVGGISSSSSSMIYCVYYKDPSYIWFSSCLHN